MRSLALGILTCMALFMSGCRTGGVILRETPMSVSETRRIVVSVIGEPRSVSQNGRELTSRFYDRKDKVITKMEMARERYYTHITVLGDRRPYDIQVQVLVESRNADGGFDLANRDDDKAAIIAERLRQALNQSRENRNVIDDFRSF